MAKVISLQNRKGGVGKTETSLNLSFAFSQAGYKTLLVINDPQDNGTSTVLDESILGLSASSADEVVRMYEDNKEKGQEDLHSAINALDEFLDSQQIHLDLAEVLDRPNCVRDAILKTKYENLSVIPASSDLSMSDTMLKASGKNPSGRLRTAISYVEEDFDVIIIDNSPFENSLTYNAMCACYKEGDMIIIPLKISRGGLKGLRATIRTLLDWLETEPLQYDFKILVTMANKNKIDTNWISALKTIFKGRVFDSVIRYQAKPVTDASINNKILIEKSQQGVADDYRAFCLEVLSTMEN